MTTLWRIEGRGPMPIIRAANARLDDELEPLPVSWSVFEDGSPEAGRIDILFDHQPDADAFVREIGLEPDDVDILFAPLPDEDWIAMSLEGLPSVEAGRFLVYGEHTSGDLAEGQFGLWIEAGPAFGTGHHGTTKGCLEALDKIDRSDFRPATVLDLGAGTGLLAIAAAKIWPACEILATDIDEESVIETVENAAKNGVKSRIEAVVADGFHHPVLEARSFDLIFANILAGPLITLAPGIVSRLEKGGRVILSGLLEEQSDKVEAAYDALGLKRIDKAIQDGWVTLVYAG
ncbi:50S ribosomal protein L11 methyltransferase [Oceanicaulis alexandrii]|uniref:50S ribosomal protein L11 methyltransferase n=1 Tax=Oceanicaulis alexandrii TaxID=153233 RepID=UPI0035D09B29